MNAIESLTESLIQKGYIPKEERELYLYGLDISFYTIWSTAVLFLIGLILRQFPASLIIVLGFYTFQSTGGGYHANTHLKCLITMIVGLLVGLSFVFFKNNHFILWTLLGVGVLLLLLFPLVLHPNKAYLEPERQHLSSRSVIMTLSIGALAIIINVFWYEFLYAFSATFLLAGISRIAGKMIYGKTAPGIDSSMS